MIHGTLFHFQFGSKTELMTVLQNIAHLLNHLYIKVNFIKKK